MNLELCRLCGKNSGLTDVFDEQDLCMKIFMCFGVKIHEDDGITRKICKSCYFFTNSVYEFRLSSIAHDSSLRKEFIEIQPKTEIKPPIISYPSEISQDAFLNTLNLANKNDVDLLKKPGLHPSVVRLKRKFPNLNFPKECLELDIDPIVPLGRKVPRLDTDNLGIWSVKKKMRGRDLVLTRVRDDSAIDSDSGSDSIKVKFNFKLKNNSIETKPSSTPLPAPKKRSKNKYPVYGGRKTVRSSKLTPPRKSPDKPKNQNEIKKQNIPAASVADDRVALKSLLQSDAQMNESLQKVNIETQETNIDLSAPRLEDYDNLLVSRGDEVQTFICQTCNKIFDTVQLLNQHKKYSHKSSLRCTKCSKRFSIVETLMKHTLSCHAEPLKLPAKPEEKREVVKTVARKKTSGSLPIESQRESQPSSSKDIIEYVISSDDDFEIVNEETSEKPQNEIPPKPAVENAITAALEPQKTSNSKEENSILKAALVPHVTTSQEKSAVENLLEQEKLPTNSNNEVFLIDDSDDEQAPEEFKTVENNPTSTDATSKEQETFLIDDTSGDSSKSKEIVATVPPISSITTTQPDSPNLPSTSPSIIENDSDISRNIVVVPSAEDKEHIVDASSSNQAKITNELSYVNYIFNKCSFVDRPMNDKKYFLKDIQRFTEKTYLPVEILKSNITDVSIEYGPMSAPKSGEKLAFWDTGNVIDIRKPENPLKKNPIPVVTAKPTGTGNRGNGPKTNVSQVLKSVQLNPKHISFSPNNFTEVTPTHQTTSTTQLKTVQSDITKVGLNTNQASPNSNEDLSRAMMLQLSHQNYQIVSNTSKTYSKTNVVLPSVAVSQSQTSVSNIPHSQVAKQKVTQNIQITPYSKPNTISYLPKPVQTVSPNRGSVVTEIAKATEQPAPISTGYILMGITATQDGIQPSGNGPIIIGDDVNKISLSKPIVINGMSYPSVTKMRNQQSSTIVLQPMVQETNVNIQNCINICQDNSINTSEQFATLTLPVVIGSQSTNDQSSVVNALPAVMSTAQIQSAAPSTSTSDEALAPKPAIRIKNLSELRGDTMNTNQRNELHNLYTNALTNYVQNHSSTMTGSNSEEYLQIS